MILIQETHHILLQFPLPYQLYPWGHCHQRKQPSKLKCKIRVSKRLPQLIFQCTSNIMCAKLLHTNGLNQKELRTEIWPKDWTMQTRNWITNDPHFIACDVTTQLPNNIWNLQTCKAYSWCNTHQNLQEPFCSLQGSTCSFEGNNDYQLFILYHGDIGDFPKVYNCF